MMSDFIGVPHSIQRYVAFRLVAGALAGVVAALLGFDLPVVAMVAGIVAGWTAGMDRSTGMPAPTGT